MSEADQPLSKNALKKKLKAEKAAKAKAEKEAKRAAAAAANPLSNKKKAAEIALLPPEEREKKEKDDHVIVDRDNDMDDIQNKEEEITENENKKGLWRLRCKHHCYCGPIRC